jgi:hypothetical protein
MNSVTMMDLETMTRVLGSRALAGGNAAMKARNRISIGTLTRVFRLAE